MRTVILITVSITVLSLLSACAQEPEEVPEPETTLPPSFLDEPPPPPTSATEILGGGTLVLTDGTLIEDSLIVITDGKIVTWGRRGEVDVPNDSVGHDLRGKWIQTDKLEVGALADLQFSERTSDMTEVNSQIIGGYQNGRLDLPSD